MTLSRAFRIALMFISAPVTAMMFRLMIWRATRVKVGPFNVIVQCKRELGAQLTKFADAAALLKQYDVRRYRRVIESLRLIVVVDQRMEDEANYFHHAKAVLISADVLQALWVESVAAMLVHEATHAFLENRGIRYVPHARPRIERLCARNEIWFLRKVPGAEALVEVKQQDLATDEA